MCRQPIKYIVAREHVDQSFQRKLYYNYREEWDARAKELPKVNKNFLKFVQQIDKKFQKNYEMDLVVELKIMYQYLRANQCEWLPKP